ncbi:mobile element protein [Streptomyces sp. NL15-2K]|nr:mobile element protein [Streptomyces sp. NL15-2K]
MTFKIRKNRMVAQGPRTLVREREEYFRLVDQGMTYAEAARAVGINLRTGKRWRNRRNASGRFRAAPPINSVVPSVVEETAPPALSRYLREADRIHIADRLREKASVRAIAAELGRSPLDHRPRDPPQPHGLGRRPLVLPAPCRPASVRRPPASPQDREDRPEPGAARLHPGPPDPAVES